LEYLLDGVFLDSRKKYLHSFEDRLKIGPSG
jgi:hypothetical protein